MTLLPTVTPILRRSIVRAVAAGAAAVLAACSAPPTPPRPPPAVVPHAPASRLDSIQDTGVILYSLARDVGTYGGEAGALPATLAPIIQARPQTSAGQSYPTGMDVWGRAIRYTPEGFGFALRSAGPDGEWGTADDVIATGRRGRDRPCTLRSQIRTQPIDPPCADTLPGG